MYPWVGEETFHPEPQLRMLYPSWTPDGTIAFSHVERLEGHGPVRGTLYGVNRDGNSLNELVPEKEPIAEHATWAPFMNELAYHKQVGETDKFSEVIWQVAKASS